MFALAFFICFLLPLMIVEGLVRTIFRTSMTIIFRPRPREPLERSLIHASRGAGFAVLLLLWPSFYAANGGHFAASDGSFGSLVYLVLLVLAVVLCFAGMSGCWGVRSPEATVWAATKCVLGAILAGHLWNRYPVFELAVLRGWSLPWSDFFAWVVRWWAVLLERLGAQIGFAIGVYLAVTGAVRLLLLTVGGTGALRRILAHIRRRIGRMVPGRQHRFTGRERDAND